MSSPPKEAHLTEGSKPNESLAYYQELKLAGYEPIVILRNSDRYVAYEVVKDGAHYFFKGVKGVKPRKLKTEEWFSKQLNVRSEVKALAIVPRIIESKTNWYIAEFLNGSPLCPEATCYETDLSAYVPALVGILTQVDKLNLPPRASVKDSLDGPTASKAAASAVRAGIIDDDLSRRALGFIGNGPKAQEIRVQHGDFTAWHVFDLGDDHFGIIDSEHAGALPRFTDLAFIYERIFNRCGAPQTAATLLSLFIDNHIEDKEAFTDNFLPVLANKALVGTFYSTIDWVDHDYKTTSKDLLEHCLANDLSKLTA